MGLVTTVTRRWQIGYKPVNRPNISETNLTYTGSTITFPLPELEEGIEVSGDTSGLLVGNYNIVFIPNKNHCWSDGTREPMTITWQIVPEAASIPVLSGELVYTGSSQVPQWSCYDESKVTLDVTPEVDAGTYQAVFSLKEGYAWTDGTIEPKSVAWSIKKAPGSLSLGTTSISLNTGEPTKEVTVTRSGDGAISAVSSNTEIASVVVSGTKITITGKASGTATITVTVAEGMNYLAPAAQTISVAMDAYVTISELPVQKGTLTYTGSGQNPVWDNYDASRLELSGQTVGTNAGKYTATFTPKAGYRWSDGTSVAKNVDWSISPVKLQLPVQKGTLVYNGSPQSVTWDNYNPEHFDSDYTNGIWRATDAGTYDIELGPLAPNYKWWDGSGKTKAISWTIEKAQAALNLIPESLNFSKTGAENAQTVSIETESTGQKTISSEDTSVATTSLEGSTITVTPVARGNTSISVNVTGDTNYLAPIMKSCQVTIADSRLPAADSFASLIQQGLGPDTYSVGDCIGIPLDGTVGILTLSGTYYPQIIGFNHNRFVEGGSLAHYVDLQWAANEAGDQMAFCDSAYSAFPQDTTVDFRMNHTGANVGGYDGSMMAQQLCPAFLNLINSEWRALIKEAIKYTDNTGGGKNVASYVTYKQYMIWLLAEFEVHGQRYYANSTEQNYQKQYDMYVNGISRVRKKHNKLATAAWWWLRSPYSSNSYNFRAVTTDGSSGSNGAGYSGGFSPSMRIGA